MASLLFSLLGQVCWLLRFFSSCFTSLKLIFKLSLWSLLFCSSFIGEIKQKLSGPLIFYISKPLLKLSLPSYISPSVINSSVLSTAYPSYQFFLHVSFYCLHIHLLNINNFLYIAVVICCSFNHHINLCRMLIAMEMPTQDWLSITVETKVKSYCHYSLLSCVTFTTVFKCIYPATSL